MPRALRATLVLILTATVLAPAAEAGPFYFVGKLGSTDTRIDPADGFTNVLDGDDNSSSFGLGLKLGRRIAFQAEYIDLGSIPGFRSACRIDELCISVAIPVEADSSAVAVTVLPHLDLTRRLQLYGKVGFISWETDLSDVSDAGDAFLSELSDEELVWGAGVRLDVPGPIGAFAEYERIADLFDSVSIGATWGF